MLLLVGLGNPGSQYARQRHNVGFMVADAIHGRHGFSPWRHRFQADTSEARFGSDKCLLIKPQTYMNESGRSVGQAASFFKIPPEQIVVIHDEVDLPPGKFRMKAGGGVAGHNGLKSIRAAIGDDFRRFRIGVGHPGRREAVPHYVLHDFAKADRNWLAPMMDAAAEHVPLLVDGKDSTFANKLHAALYPDDEQAGKKKSKPGSRNAGPTSSSAEPASEPEGPLARGLRKLFGG